MRDPHDDRSDEIARPRRVIVERAQDVGRPCGNAQFLLQFAQGGLFHGFAGIEPPSRQGPLPAVGAQPRGAFGQQEGGLARHVGFDHDDGHGRAFEISAVGGEAPVETIEPTTDLRPQRRIEGERSHAAKGFLKVQTTAGGTLRQMRWLGVQTICSACRRARGIGGRGP